MYVCMFVCMYVCMYVYMYICMYVHSVYVYSMCVTRSIENICAELAWVCAARVYGYACMYVCMYVCMYTCICIYIYTCLGLCC